METRKFTNSICKTDQHRLMSTRKSCIHSTRLWRRTSHTPTCRV